MSLALRSRSLNSDASLDHTADILSGAAAGNQAASQAESKVSHADLSAAPHPGVTEAGRGLSVEEEGKEGEEEEEEQTDTLFIHLRNNMETIREFCKDLMQQIPTPDHCTIQGHYISHPVSQSASHSVHQSVSQSVSQRLGVIPAFVLLVSLRTCVCVRVCVRVTDSAAGGVARLSFSCPLKSPSCLYAKSCFYLSGQQPHLWMQLMLLQLQVPPLTSPLPPAGAHGRGQ